MNQRLVSCLMPTYARFPEAGNLVEESLESFLRQDYKKKELIILNDCPGQRLIFSHPNVIVINTNRRIRTLGEKYNIMAALSNGQLLCPWEDDDISLPWRISLSVDKLDQKNYWCPKNNYWLSDNNKYKYNSNTSITSQSIFTRKIFDNLQGFPHTSVRYGEKFSSMIANSVYSNLINPKTWFYIYRKNSNSYQNSTTVDAYNRLGQIKIIDGDFYLNPHWEENYIKIIRSIIKKGKTSKQF